MIENENPPKSHVQHTISLIQEEELALFQEKNSFIEKIGHTTGSAD